MKNIAIIPARGGSKGIPKKNIKDFCGKPLIYWSLKAAIKSNVFDEIYVATDDVEIASTVYELFHYSKVDIYFRKPSNATDKSSTEDLLLEFIDFLESIDNKYKEDFRLTLIQCTNPFLLSDNLQHVLYALDYRNESLVSVAKSIRFFWTEQIDNNYISNYLINRRPRRQDIDDDNYKEYYIENGSFYISTKEKIKFNKVRVSNPIVLYTMNDYTQFEIDDELDWKIAEMIFKEKKYDQK